MLEPDDRPADSLPGCAFGHCEHRLYELELIEGHYKLRETEGSLMQRNHRSSS